MCPLRHFKEHKMKHTRVTLSDVDGYVRDDIFGSQNEKNSDKLRLIRTALTQDATPKQRRYIIMYYKDGMTMEEIADACGVARSTVSRTIARGRNGILAGLKKAELKKLFEMTLGQEDMRGDTDK